MNRINYINYGEKYNQLKVEVCKEIISIAEQSKSTIDRVSGFRAAALTDRSTSTIIGIRKTGDAIIKDSTGKCSDFALTDLVLIDLIYILNVLREIDINKRDTMSLNYTLKDLVIASLKNKNLTDLFKDSFPGGLRVNYELKSAVMFDIKNKKLFLLSYAHPDNDTAKIQQEQNSNLILVGWVSPFEVYNNVVTGDDLAERIRKIW